MSDLKALTMGEVENLVGQLKVAVAAPSSKATFHATLVAAINVLGLTDETIAKRFGASRPTVTRWRDGSNAPHAALYKTVYTWLLSEANACMEHCTDAMRHTPLGER